MEVKRSPPSFMYIFYMGRMYYCPKGHLITSNCISKTKCCTKQPDKHLLPDPTCYEKCETLCAKSRENVSETGITTRVFEDRVSKTLSPRMRTTRQESELNLIHEK